MTSLRSTGESAAVLRQEYKYEFLYYDLLSVNGNTKQEER